MKLITVLSLLVLAILVGGSSYHNSSNVVTNSNTATPLLLEEPKSVRASILAKRIASERPKVIKRATRHRTLKPVAKSTRAPEKKVRVGGIAACIAKYESGGNPRAQNPNSSASGLYQFIDGTWNNYGGYSRAMHAPVSVQTAKFYEVWAGGRGAHHWVVAHKCGF